MGGNHASKKQNALIMAKFIRSAPKLELFVVKSVTGPHVHYVKPDGTVTRNRSEAAAVSWDNAIRWLGGSVTNNLEKV